MDQAPQMIHIFWPTGHFLLKQEFDQAAQHRAASTLFLLQVLLPLPVRRGVQLEDWQQCLCQLRSAVVVEVAACEGGRHALEGGAHVLHSDGAGVGPW
eukprot:2677515-Prymnesium_polylepis.1